MASLSSRLFCSVLVAASLMVAPRIYAGEVDWSKVPAYRVPLFYPGVTSWDFLISDDHRLGSRDVRIARKECRHCHLSKEGELDLKADEIASGSYRMKMSHNPMEPDPVPGKQGRISAYIKAAYDDENIYIRVEWGSSGISWHSKDEKLNPDMVSMQINKTEDSFRKYGCFVTCHNDLYTMPDSPPAEEVKKNPYYGKLGRDDVRLYAYYAKDNWKDSSQPKVKDEDGLIDLWSIDFRNGSSEVRDGYIYTDRIWQAEPALNGTGSWNKRKYTAEFTRKLDTQNRFDVPFKDGDVITVDISIHDGGTARRKHYVSFPIAVGLGTSADLKAKRLK